MMQTRVQRRGSSVHVISSLSDGERTPPEESHPYSSGVNVQHTRVTGLGLKSLDKCCSNTLTNLILCETSDQNLSVS